MESVEEPLVKHSKEEESSEDVIKIKGAGEDRTFSSSSSSSSSS